MIPELIAFGGVLAALGGVYFQFRQVRIAEANLRQQLSSVAEVVKKLETERQERLAAQRALETATQGALSVATRASKSGEHLTETCIGLTCTLISRVAGATDLLAAWLQGTLKPGPERALLNSLHEMIDAQRTCADALQNRMLHLLEGGSPDSPSDFPKALETANAVFISFFQSIDDCAPTTRPPLTRQDNN